jgi:hypothetical protein
LLQKTHSVVKILRIRLTRRINLNSLSTQQVEKFGYFRVARTIATAGLLAAVVAGLTACAALERRAPQEVVKEKAQARWNALVKSDIPAAYAYLSPGSKAVMTQDAYRNSIRPGFWKSAAVERVECATTDSCDVVATIEYEIQGRRLKTPLKETWIREGSDWWYVQK